MKKIKRQNFNCLQCGHSWLSLKEEPKLCPKCRSRKWNKPPAEVAEKVAEKYEIVIPEVKHGQVVIPDAPIIIPEIEKEIEKKLKPETEKKKELVTRSYTKRSLGLAGSGLCLIIGLGMFFIYIGNPNMFLGAMGVIFIVTGVFFLNMFWKKPDEIIKVHQGEVTKEQVNCLKIRPDEIIFENMEKPSGFLRQCDNDHKFYYVYIYDSVRNDMVPFEEPDQVYLDPEIFGQRYLSLPAHRRVFARKPKGLAKFKTALLVVSLAIMFLLIMITGGGA